MRSASSLVLRPLPSTKGWMRTVSAWTAMPSTRAVQSDVCSQRQRIVSRLERSSTAICSGATPRFNPLVR